VTVESPEFLDVEDVIELHGLQLARYGDAAARRRDRGLLESALAQPQATFDGVSRDSGRFRRHQRPSSAGAYWKYL
jgi:hypothetical protein